MSGTAPLLLRIPRRVRRRRRSCHVRAADAPGPIPNARIFDPGSTLRPPEHAKPAELRSEFPNQISNLQEAY